MKKLVQWLRRRLRREVPQPDRMGNPYRRLYTRDRTVEEIGRARVEREKKDS